MTKSSLRSLPGDRPESRWDFRGAFDRAPMATFLFDDATRACLEANNAAELLTAFSRDELLDRRIEDLHPRERRDRALEYFERFRREPGFTYDDLNLETKDGRVVPVEVRGTSLGFDERKIILVYVRDITEERLLQREVLFQNHKLTTLNALSSAIRNSMELSEILSGSLRVIMDASGSVYGEVLIYDEESAMFQIAALRGEGASEPPRKPLSGTECELARHVLVKGEPILLESLAHEPRLSELLKGRPGIGAAAGVPLRNKNRVMGVMQLAIATDQLFPMFDFELFTSIGVQIGMAAENAVLFQRTARQAKQI